MHHALLSYCHMISRVNPPATFFIPHERWPVVPITGRRPTAGRCAVYLFRVLLETGIASACFMIQISRSLAYMSFNTRDYLFRSCPDPALQANTSESKNSTSHSVTCATLSVAHGSDLPSTQHTRGLFLSPFLPPSSRVNTIHKHSLLVFMHSTWAVVGPWAS